MPKTGIQIAGIPALGRGICFYVGQQGQAVSVYPALRVCLRRT